MIYLDSEVEQMENRLSLVQGELDQKDSSDEYEHGLMIKIENIFTYLEPWIDRPENNPWVKKAKCYRWEIELLKQEREKKKSSILTGNALCGISGALVGMFIYYLIGG